MIHTDHLDTATAPPPSPGPTGRWYLHRAGILNVWQYDRTELLFGGGRALLRGKNGAGKSKALEMLLPFLLDGDTRRLDSTGRDRTTVRWLMTSDRDPGNHLGYVWLELRLVADWDLTGADAETDEARYLTLGAGLRASSTTGRSDHWFFITDRRVGVDLRLDTAGECLSLDRLRAELGDTAVCESGAEHRRRVGRLLFGLSDEAQYRNLIHLLHRLRDPNIGNRVEQGELASILTDALPPPDEDAIRKAAGRFDDLEKVREQVERSRQTAEALNGFLDAYRAYSRTVLRHRIAAVAEAEKTRSTAARLVQRLGWDVTAAREEREAAERAQTDLEQERSLGLAELRALEQSEAYRAHLDLLERQQTVAALEGRAEDAEGHRQELEQLAGQAEAETATRREEAESLCREAAAATTAAREALTGTGLDAAIVGPPPPETAVTEPTFDHVGIATRAAHTADAVTARRRAAHRVRELATKSNAAAERAARADERAAESEAELEAAEQHHEAARTRLADATASWSEAVSAWTSDPIVEGVDWAEVHSRLGSPSVDTDWAEAVAVAAADALVNPRKEMREAAARAEVALQRSQTAAREAGSRLSELESTSDTRPEPGRYRRAERNPSLGSAFYELVDFRSDVPAPDRAGLEAALESSGMLDAWVNSEGTVVDPRTEDVLLRAHPSPVTGPSLADLLEPAATPDSPVGKAVVRRLLRSVPVGETASDIWVTTDGRWSTGVLRGAWSKPDVEYLGAGAREATRQRRIDTARRELSERRNEADRAARLASEARAGSDRMEEHAASLPPRRELDEAEAGVALSEERLASAHSRHEEDRLRAEQARGDASRAMAKTEQEAARDGLPTRVGEIDDIIGGLRDSGYAVREWQGALRRLHDSVQRLQSQETESGRLRSRVEQAVTRAQELRSRHAEAHHELRTLKEAVGAEVEETMARHADLTEQIGTLEQSALPRATERGKEALEEASRVEAEHQHAASDEMTSREEVVSAGRALTSALVLPGLSLAAFDIDLATPADLLDRDYDESAPQDAAALAKALDPLVTGDDAGDSLILSRYDQLQHALAGGYDTAMEETDGIKVIHVSDDSGRRPLAVVAARVSAEADAARDRFASQEEEVVERFLVREVADEVRARLLDATDLVAQANQTLAGVRSSHGKGVHLNWKVDDNAPDAAGTAVRLLVDTLRNDQEERELRSALLRLIEIERLADPSAGYEQYLRSALDYRQWHLFTVEVTDDTRPGSRRKLSNRLGLSQGEQRVLSYLALFAAASAQYDAIARQAAAAPRLLLLDDAFAKVDEPTHAQLLRHLVDLGLDFLITSERLWGCFPTVPSLEIYEAVRDPAVPGIALLHFHWDGRQRHLRGM